MLQYVFGTIKYTIAPLYIHLLSPPELVLLAQTKSPHMNHSSTTVPTIIPASLNMATLFPLAAMQPRRPAEPFKEVLIEEKVSDCGQN